MGEEGREETANILVQFQLKEEGEPTTNTFFPPLSGLSFTLRKITSGLLPYPATVYSPKSEAYMSLFRNLEVLCDYLINVSELTDSTTDQFPSSDCPIRNYHSYLSSFSPKCHPSLLPFPSSSVSSSETNPDRFTSQFTCLQKTSTSF